METEPVTLAHSVSMSETLSNNRTDQNQNEANPNFVKESPLRLAGSRLTKSASWFNSISRRASSRKTPMKKSSISSFRSSTSSNDSFTRPRLNKSDWDVRSHEDVASPATFRGAARSTDCLDVMDDQENIPDLSTLDLSTMEEGEAVIPNPALYYTIDSRRLASKHKKSLKERKLLNGVKAFNLEPEKGLKYLQEFNFIDSTPQSVAKFYSVKNGYQKNK